MSATIEKHVAAIGEDIAAIEREIETLTRVRELLVGESPPDARGRHDFAPINTKLLRTALEGSPPDPAPRRRARHGSRQTQALEVLGESADGLMVGQLASGMRVRWSQAHALLRSLEAKGRVGCGEDKRWRVTSP